MRIERECSHHISYVAENKNEISLEGKATRDTAEDLLHRPLCVSVIMRSDFLGLAFSHPGFHLCWQSPFLVPVGVHATF